MNTLTCDTTVIEEEETGEFAIQTTTSLFPPSLTTAPPGCTTCQSSHAYCASKVSAQSPNSVSVNQCKKQSLQTTPPIITTYAEESSYLYFVLLFLMIARISKLVCSGKVDKNSHMIKQQIKSLVSTSNYIDITNNAQILILCFKFLILQIRGTRQILMENQNSKQYSPSGHNSYKLIIQFQKQTIINENTAQQCVNYDCFQKLWGFHGMIDPTFHF